MQAAIGYLRVSTREQGRRGLGLAAQRFEIEAFGAREGFSVKSCYQGVQTGAGADALLLRPGLATPLKEVRTARCPLIVSRLDRLSRNVHFIVAALGRDWDEFTLHISCVARRARAEDDLGDSFPSYLVSGSTVVPFFFFNFGNRNAEDGLTGRRPGRRFLAAASRFAGFSRYPSPNSIWKPSSTWAALL